MQVDRYKLLRAPYVAPAINAGDILTDERFGNVRTGGYTAAPIPWPRLLKTGRHAPILCGDLVRTVRTESAIAVAHHWGVNETTVWKWRKVLGVDQINEGTMRLYREYKGHKLSEEVTAVGRAKARSAEARAKMSATKKGRKMHPATAKALLHSISLRKKKSHRISLKKSNELYWLKRMPPIDKDLVRAVIDYRKIARAPSPAVKWHPCEEALLGLGPDRVIAEILGRSRVSVTLHRQSKGVAPFARVGQYLIDPKGKIAKRNSTFSDAEIAEIFGIEISS